MSEHSHSESHLDSAHFDDSHLDTTTPDSKIDAWAIFILIVLAVSTAVFWVSHQ